MSLSAGLKNADKAMLAWNFCQPNFNNVIAGEFYESDN